jgi:hypothetical protein
MLAKGRRRVLIMGGSGELFPVRNIQPLPQQIPKSQKLAFWFIFIDIITYRDI